MKLSAILTAAALALPIASQACIGSQQDTTRPNLRYYPIVGDTTSHWPARQAMVIGSIASFLVPLQAKIQLNDTERGMMAPLTIFGEPSHEQIRASRDIVPKWVDIEHDPKKYRWVHIHASSFGVSEVQMNTTDGWSKKIIFSMAYPSKLDKPLRPPVEVTIGKGDVPVVRVDGRDNIEVTVAGNVADGWIASPHSETGFNLIRVQKVEKISGEPQVKLFFEGTSSPRKSTMRVRRGSSDAAETFEFKIMAMPTAAC